MACLIQLLDEPTCAYTYIVFDNDSKLAVAIDPVLAQLERDLALLRRLCLRLIWTIETHTHADHLTSAAELRKRVQSQIAISVRSKATGADLRISDGDVIQVTRYLSLSVLETPGHTPDSVSLACDAFLFTGDTLLIEGCGRSDLQEGDARQLYFSLERLCGMSDSLLVYPGHDYTGRHASSISHERYHNSRFANQSVDEFVEVMNNLNLPMPKAIDEAIPHNLAFY